MIEVLAQLAQPPAIIAQLPAITFQDNLAGCPGFTSQQIELIGRAAANHAYALHPGPYGKVRILYAGQFYDIDNRNVSEQQRLMRFEQFTRQPAPQYEYRYVFFCPSASYDPRMDQTTVAGFGTWIISQIEDFFDLPRDSLEYMRDVWAWFNIGRVLTPTGNSFDVGGGSLFYVK